MPVDSMRGEEMLDLLRNLLDVSLPRPAVTHPPTSVGDKKDPHSCISLPNML